jgi:hypothetical protein
MYRKEEVMERETWWCLKSPNVGLQVSVSSPVRNIAIRVAEMSYKQPWKAMKAEGYRCVKITVKEVK